MFKIYNENKENQAANAKNRQFFVQFAQKTACSVKLTYVCRSYDLALSTNRS